MRQVYDDYVNKDMTNEIYKKMSCNMKQVEMSGSSKTMLLTPDVVESNSIKSYNTHNLCSDLRNSYKYVTVYE